MVCAVFTTSVGIQLPHPVPLVSRCMGLHQVPTPYTPPRGLAGALGRFLGQGETDEGAAGEIPPHLPAVRIEVGSGREAILPTLGWGKQSIWLAASGSQTPFCGQKPAPTFP